MNAYKDQEWYNNLKSDGKYISDLIFKYHDNFKNKDKKYKNIVFLYKISVLILAMISTIILGLKLTDECWGDFQINAGLVLSAIITFVTVLSSYFNFERYWMRNIAIHIELNILRDNFILDAETNQIDEEKVKFYLDKLNDIQKRNIKYWEDIIKKN